MTDARGAQRRSVRWAWLLCWLWSLAGGCVSSSDDLRGLAAEPPLDLSVLVTGGAFGDLGAVEVGTFAGAPSAADGEVIAIDSIVDVLARGRVFQRVHVDADPARRRAMRDRLLQQRPDDELLQFLQQARSDGFDLLLVIEELQDGPIEQQGTNSRWPVTLATWVLLGVGLLIPDRTFESRATLRVSVRDLQTGRVLHDPPLLVAGPTELSLIERTDLLGLCMSIVVPPFWVGDDPAAVRDSVRATTERRLLLSMARDLKSESVRRRLRERSAAAIELRDGAIEVAAGESVSVVQLRAAGLPAAAAERFAEALLGSGHRVGDGYRYRAELPPLPGDAEVQVLVGTLRGGVASATFRSGAAR